MIINQGIQWQDAFYDLYPQANILVAGANDFKKENRETLFSSIATGDYDAVIIPHSSFKTIGLPLDTLSEIIDKEIEEIETAIENMDDDGEHKSFIKDLEKRRKGLKARFEKQANAENKDEAIIFDRLGIDGLFLDESQEYKNLGLTTTLRNVRGLGNLKGSEKAFDLYVKTRYLAKKHNGRGIYFSTGTVISNTIAELYTNMKYMAYDLLEDKGLLHFDAWRMTFGKVESSYELDATGINYAQVERFSKFQNVGELIAFYRFYADVITTADMVANNGGVALTPGILGGKPENVIGERSPLVEEYMMSIVERMQSLTRDRKRDNALKITNDARKAGLDYRLIDPSAPDFEGSKVNLCADRVFQFWKDWEQDKVTQLVFCDLSTPKGIKNETKKKPKADLENDDDAEDSLSMDELLANDSNSNFSVYDDLKTKLINRGIPAHEIKFIHEFKTDAQKAKLFRAVNNGEVRVLIGSTAKMGAGTNVQKRLVALHHLDCPWRPSDLEQRNGRGLRQGNILFKLNPNFLIAILQYATEKTYDARIWQIIIILTHAIPKVHGVSLRLLFIALFQCIMLK